MKLFGSRSRSGVEPSTREGKRVSEAIQVCRGDPDVKAKCVLLIIVVILVIFVPLKFGFRKDFPSIFLSGCIITALLAIFGKVIVQNLGSSDCSCNLSRCTVRKVAFIFLKGLYVLVTIVIIVTAGWVFKKKETTDKEKSPRNHVTSTAIASCWVFSIIMICGISCPRLRF